MLYILMFDISFYRDWYELLKKKMEKHKQNGRIIKSKTEITKYQSTDFGKKEEEEEISTKGLEKIIMR